MPSARTCSLARTVPHPGHQLTGASARYARPAFKKARKIVWDQRMISGSWLRTSRRQS